MILVANELITSKHETLSKLLSDGFEALVKNTENFWSTTFHDDMVVYTYILSKANIADEFVETIVCEFFGDSFLNNQIFKIKTTYEVKKTPCYGLESKPVTTTTIDTSMTIEEFINYGSLTIVKNYLDFVIDDLGVESVYSFNEHYPILNGMNLLPSVGAIKAVIDIKALKKMLNEQLTENLVNKKMVRFINDNIIEKTMKVLPCCSSKNEEIIILNYINTDHS